jgi:3-oxoacyl-[acyl-carrier-protein] synthase II
VSAARGHGDPVITGRGIAAALGLGLDATWEAIVAGRTGLRRFERLPADRYATEFAGEVPAELLSSLTSDGSGPAFALAREAARQAMEEAGLAPGARRGAALVLATTKAEIGELESAEHRAGRMCRGRAIQGVLARDLAQELGIGGPAVAVSNACASGGIAVMQAARMLARGRLDCALVVGVDLVSDFVMCGFSSLKALSPRPCRPFDADREGLSVGEGAAAVVMARTPGPRAGVAALEGWGSSNDANHITGPSRDGSGLALAIRRALSRASLEAGDVGYVNAHGTGTDYNDAMEAKAFHLVFGRRSGPAASSPSDDPTLRIGPPVSSLKGYLGHTMGAAGLIETVLCTKVLEEGLLPATAGLRTPGVGEPIRLLAEHAESPGLARVLSVNSGFGGVNAALVIGKAS